MGLIPQPSGQTNFNKLRMIFSPHFVWLWFTKLYHESGEKSVDTI